MKPAHEQEGETLTESRAGTLSGIWGRWRTRAAIAVLAIATVVAAGYLIAEYRSPADESLAAVSGASPSGSGLPAAPASASVSARPSVVPSSSRPASPRASSKPPPRRNNPGGFPGPGNTGVPAGARLSTYTGPCTITKNGAVVTDKTIKCDPFLIKAKEVTIRRSQLLGSLVTTEATPYSFLLEDSEVDAGVYQGPAVGSTNMTIRRSNIHGGQANVLCYAKCDIQDSWLHGPGLKEGADWHLNAFLANDTDSSGRSDVTLVHNTIHCDTRQNSAGGGCSGDLSLFADFGPVSHVTVRGNLFGASPDISYCVYGGSSTKEYSGGVQHIVFEDNVFQRGSNRKCSAYGPVTSFDTRLTGNVWKNNRWEDGSAIAAAN
jgi:hypothetical protein